MTRERPILFGAPMVRALLAGTKSQTRRVFTPQSTPWINHYMEGGASPSDWKAECGDDGDPRMWWWLSGAAAQEPIGSCPYGVPGDRLWVRETFYCDHSDYPTAPRRELLPLMEYRADHDCSSWEAGCPCRDENGRGSWRPSIFMPRWASRITLEVTEVRVQHVQDISEEDAKAEGVNLTETIDGTVNGEPARIAFMEAKYAFAVLWNSINEKRGHGWQTNPWCWCVSFKRVAP